MKGVGTIIAETISTFGIKSKGCSSCEKLANELNQVGPDLVELNLDFYVTKFKESIKTWRREHSKIVPVPPDAVLKKFLQYAIAKSRESALVSHDNHTVENSN